MGQTSLDSIRQTRSRTAKTAARAATAKIKSKNGGTERAMLPVWQARQTSATAATRVAGTEFLRIPIQTASPPAIRPAANRKKEQRSYRHRYGPKSHRYCLARPKDCNSGLLFTPQRPWLGDGGIERDNTCETPFICLDGQYYRKNLYSRF